MYQILFDERGLESLSVLKEDGTAQMSFRSDTQFLFKIAPSLERLDDEIRTAGQDGNSKQSA
jgi:hypothetical protein